MDDSEIKSRPLNGTDSFHESFCLNLQIERLGAVGSGVLREYTFQLERTMEIDLV